MNEAGDTIWKDLTARFDPLDFKRLKSAICLITRERIYISYN